MRNLKLLTIIIAVLVISCGKKEITEPEPTPPAGAQDYKITLTKASDASTDWKLKIDAAVADRANVWIDLNNNGKKDNGEAITKFGESDANLNTFPFSGSNTVVLYGKITVLNCDENKLVALDVTKNPLLEKLDCNYNYKITALDVSKNIKMKYLHLTSGLITELNLSQNTELIELDCRLNQITMLDVSRNIKLEYLNIERNKITLLDISKNILLTEFYCELNKLKALDVSRNTKLKTLNCTFNEITSIDLSKNLDITKAHIYFNSIDFVNMSQLITNLPSRSVADNAQIYLLDHEGSGKFGNPIENNTVPSKASINTAKAKNWKLYYIGGEF